jgi:serine/threonine-protein kinase
VARRTRFRPIVTYVPWAIAAVALAVAAFLALRPRAIPAVYRFDVSVPDSVNIYTSQQGNSMALSERGDNLVYVGRGSRGQRQLLVRGLGQLEPRPLGGTDGAESPFISPDGAWVGFFAEGKLKKVALAGGPSLALAEAPTARGGAWGPDDRIIFTPTPTSGLLSVSAAGGAVDTLTTIRLDSGETSHRFPDILPDGRSVLFTVQYGARYAIAALRLSDRSVRVVVGDGMSARWSPTGHLIYASDAGALLAVPFNPRSMAVTGSPVSLLEGLLVKIPSGAAEFTISPAGTLAYLTGTLARRALVLVDRQGRERVLTEEIAMASPRFSPDGRRIVLTSAERRSSDVRVFDIARGTLSRLSFEGINQYPEWTPDGRRISFVSSRPGAQGQDIYWVPADGSGEPTILAGGAGAQWEVAWAPDGRSLALRENTGTTGRDLSTMMMDSARTKRPYLAAQFDERSPTMSPDGRWLAYASNESGRDEIYVRAFPQPTGRWQVSVSGGTEPRWARTGGEIYYRSGDSLVSATVSVRPTFSVGAYRVLFTRPYFGDPSHAHYDVHPNNQGFAMVRAGAEPTSLVVVLGWFEELRRRSAAQR